MADKPTLNFVNPPGVGAVIRNDVGAGAGASRDFIIFKKGGSETFSVDVNGLPDPGGGDAKREVIIPFGDIVADSDAIDGFLVKFKKAVALTNIYLWVDTATADGATNRQTITIKRSSDGATVVAFQTSTDNPGLAQAAVTTMGVLSETAIAADEYLYVNFTKAESGLALSGLTFQVEYTLAA
jgi:hypothetical protein